MLPEYYFSLNKATQVGTKGNAFCVFSYIFVFRFYELQRKMTHGNRKKSKFAS